MSFWRAAGLNYVQYSNVAARCVRAALKKDLQVNSRIQRFAYCYIFSVGFLDSEPKDPKQVAGSGSEFFFLLCMRGRKETLLGGLTYKIKLFQSNRKRQKAGPGI